MTSSIILYQLPQVINLVLGGNNGEKLMNFPINRTNFIVHKTVTTEILFFIKNVDNKPVNLAMGTPKIVITDLQKTKQIFQQDFVVIDDTKGLYKLILAPTDTAQWEENIDYSYSVVFTRSTGEEVLLFTDKNYGPYGIFKVIRGPYAAPKDAISLDTSDFTPISNFIVSSAIDATLDYENTNGIYSTTHNMIDFTGKLIIQGSLENQPDFDDSYWFDIQTFDVAEATTQNVVANFTGNFKWLRFKIQPTNGSISNISVLF